MTDPASDATGAVRPRLSRNGIQLNGAGRIAGLDFARGLAIIGMLAAHLLWLGDDVVLADPSTWSNIAAGRSSTSFHLYLSKRFLVRLPFRAGTGYVSQR